MGLRTIIFAAICLLLTNTARSQPVAVITKVLVNTPTGERPDLSLYYEIERTPIFPPDHESQLRERTDRIIAAMEEIRLLLRELAEEKKLKK